MVKRMTHAAVIESWKKDEAIWKETEKAQLNQLAEQRVEIHNLRVQVAELEKDLDRERGARHIVDTALNQLVKTHSDIRKLLEK